MHGTAVLAVTAHGPGWSDPDLRPNGDAGAGGHGRSLIGQLTDAVARSRDDHRRTVTADVGS